MLRRSWRNIFYLSSVMYGKILFSYIIETVR